VRAEALEGPHAKRRGRLRNGNRPGDPSAAPRCGARTRRETLCQAPGMANGRCRLHGGKSTGPRTAEGLARCRAARWKHGRYSRKALAETRRVQALLKASEDLITAIWKDDGPK
jgi:hypothetical protein